MPFEHFWYTIVEYHNLLRKFSSRNTRKLRKRMLRWFVKFSALVIWNFSWGVWEILHFVKNSFPTIRDFRFFRTIKIDEILRIQEFSSSDVLEIATRSRETYYNKHKIPKPKHKIPILFFPKPSTVNFHETTLHYFEPSKQLRDGPFPFVTSQKKLGLKTSTKMLGTKRSELLSEKIIKKWNITR